MSFKNKATLLILLIVITATIYLVLLFPIYNKVDSAYPFYTQNAINLMTLGYIVYVIFVNDFNIFSEKIVPYAILLFLTPFMIIGLVDIYFSIAEFNQNIGFQSITTKANTQNKNLVEYMKSLNFFLSISALFAVLYLPAKLIRKIWRIKNSTKIVEIICINQSW